MVMNQIDNKFARRGARRMSEVPSAVREALSVGAVESVNLMEWLAADMSALAQVVSSEVRSAAVRVRIADAANKVAGESITRRLATFGRAIASAIPGLVGDDFELLASHRSDLVRQWACYAVNDSASTFLLGERLRLTLRFAADTNMSVRETAWMAFRPHLAADLQHGLRLLFEVACCENANQRRFAVEVTRPRSVWGAHLVALKRQPELAEDLLECVRTDSSRYVQLAVGNWLNDASKSRPDWVTRMCSIWSQNNDRRTDFIVRRGLRTLASAQKGAAGERLL
jgi:3-methyladenine DNA glycosylase AlkC